MKSLLLTTAAALTFVGAASASTISERVNEAYNDLEAAYGTAYANQVAKHVSDHAEFYIDSNGNVNVGEATLYRLDQLTSNPGYNQLLNAVSNTVINDITYYQFQSNSATGDIRIRLFHSDGTAFGLSGGDSGWIYASNGNTAELISNLAKESYEEGFNHGFHVGFAEGYDQGYHDGFIDGYYLGYNQGVIDATGINPGVSAPEY